MPKQFKVWDPEREDEPEFLNVEGWQPAQVASDWAEQKDPRLDEFDSMTVNVRDSKGALHEFEVTVEVERVYSASKLDPAGNAAVSGRTEGE